MKVTPDQIRAENRELTFTAAECTVIADALELADADARGLIECGLPHSHTGPDGAVWRDLRRADIGPDTLAQILRYLDARGLLRRDPADPCVVSFHDAPIPEVPLTATDFYTARDHTTEG